MSPYEGVEKAGLFDGGLLCWIWDCDPEPLDWGDLDRGPAYLVGHIFLGRNCVSNL
jgi:hypothetical protein